jgi:RNA polymerase sigma factor (TIGR02999 family)
MGSPAAPISELLRSCGQGDQHARERLLPLVYRDLKQRAAAYLLRERHDHTLQPTALVHEAYLRLFGEDAVAWQNRNHFYGIAARVMRQVLVDHARAHRAVKRAGAVVRVALDDQIGATRPVDWDVLALNEAVDELGRLDPRQAQIVEFRYFGGMTEQEVAALMSLSRATVTREWQTARAWLHRRMTPAEAPRP